MNNYTSHLLPQILESGASQEELYDLFVDLSMVFRNPFDEAIADAVKTRGAVYVEQLQERTN